MSKQGSCAIVCPMGFDAGDFLAKYSAGDFDAVVACDGGFRHFDAPALVARDIRPDVAVGDFDSLGFVPGDVPVIAFDCHKDFSDLELALTWAADQGISRVWVYGALGGRIDHELCVFQTLAGFAEAGMEVNAVGYDPAAEVQMNLRLLVGPGVFRLPHLPGGLVSVFSLNDQCHGVTERGLEYPLVDATLPNRGSLGLSNLRTSSSASVEVAQGTLCIIYQR